MSINASPSLPAPPNRLIGRADACLHVADLLIGDGRRLVTLTGPGGVGKTHLAMAVAETLVSNFSDGVWFVSLEQLNDPGLVLPAIARALGLQEVAGQPFLELLAETLGPRQTLLVLDNMEQVTEAAADIGRLVAACRGLSVLATSRARLRLRSEREVPVEPLAVPDPHTVVGAADAIANSAVALFVERAQAVRPSFALTDAVAPVIAEICRQLDGLPLAIELAASTINVLSPQALLGRMNNRLELLTNGAVDLPARQRSLRQAIAWSHDLLVETERRLFGRLSVFAGEFGIDAATALVIPMDPADGQGDVLSMLGALVDKSLLFRVEPDDGTARYRMLSTIQEFASERLEVAGETESTQLRLLAWALDLAERANRELTGPAQARWLATLEQEHDNLRAALVAGRSVRSDAGLRLASSLWRFWATRGYLSEGYGWLEEYIARNDGVQGDVFARAYVSQGNLALDLGDYGKALASYDHALALFECLGDRFGVADALNGKGLVHWYRGENVLARGCHQRSLGIRREIGNRQGEANSLTNLANVVKDEGDMERALSLHQQALTIRESLGDRGGAGYSWLNMGDVARRTGDARAAGELFSQSLEAFGSVRDTLGEGYARLGLGLVSVMNHDHQRASMELAEAIAIRLRLGDRRGVIECIEGIATVAARERREDESARLFGAARALRVEIEAPMPEADQALQTPTVAALTKALGNRAIDRLLAEGERMTLTEAAGVAAALSAQMASVRTHPGGLSDREVEVLGLVAAGMTNGQIAERLFLSRRTVDAHMRRIYDKLDLATRAEAVRFAADHGLAQSFPSGLD